MILHMIPISKAELDVPVNVRWKVNEKQHTENEKGMKDTRRNNRRYARRFPYLGGIGVSLGSASSVAVPICTF